MNNIKLREFTEKDIEKKIEWINNPDNNEYLHYNIPLNLEDTIKWFMTKNNNKRCDMVIEYGGIPVGIIGIINIDKKKGEYYITLGESEYKRKGISFEASKQILNYAFDVLNLEKVWLCVDEENIAARRLYEKIGFRLEGTLLKDIFFKGKMINRCMYGICKDEWSVIYEHFNN